MITVFEGIYNLITVASGETAARIITNLPDEVKLGIMALLKREDTPKVMS